MRASFTSVLLLAALGRAEAAPPNAAGDIKVDVVISIGSKDKCEVARPGATSHSTTCAGLVAYLTNVLRLPKGSMFDVTPLPGVEASDIEQVVDALEAAGYRVPKVGFITKPDGHDH